MAQLAAQIAAAAILLGVCLAVFGALGRLMPCNPGHRLLVSRAIGLDLGYCLVGVLYAGVGPAVVAVAGATPLHIEAVAGIGTWVGALPLGWQLACLIVITDFGQYWIHRAFHARPLWRFHAIHHGAEEVNWTTQFRTHPVNYLMANTTLAVLARLAGVSEDALILAAPIFFFTGAVSHANLGWTYGPLRYVLASPVFHRWHHVAAPEARDRNFAPIFSLWDVLFGTFRMPRGETPDGYGAPGVPSGLIGQMIYPFRPDPAPR
jgi:sterol desaturase/sphingolipid hydroxylase (fatty acid hydroxylase superfamily)